MNDIPRQLRVAATIVLTAFVGQAAAQGGQSEPEPPEPAYYPAPKATEATLLDVVDTGERYVIVGDHGVILYSTDRGGQQAPEWQQSPAPVSVMLNRAAFGDARHGWVVGHDGVILRTTDAAESWEIQFRDASGGQAFYDVHADSAQAAIVVGSGRVMRTRDGGENWESLTGPLFDLSWNFNAVTRLNNDCLMIAGERGILARSCDDGGSWQQLAPPYIGSYYGILPYGDDGAVVYGMRGHVYVTEDVTETAMVDSATWDPYTEDTVNAPALLEGMGWRLVNTPVERGLFDGLRFGEHGAVFVGVASNVLTGRLDTGEFTVLPNDSNAPISAVVRQDPYLLTVGRSGIRRVQYRNNDGDASDE